MRFLLTLLLVVFGACEPSPEAPAADAPATSMPVTATGYEAFGETITPDGALPVDQVAAAAADYVGQTVKLEGTVVEVCQMKGCWFTLRAPEGRNIRLMVPRADGDYVYTMPKDISGSTVIVEGPLQEETLDAETREHYADDTGRSIDAIALTELQMTPRGVLLKRS